MTTDCICRDCRYFVNVRPIPGSTGSKGECTPPDFDARRAYSWGSCPMAKKRLPAPKTTTRPLRHADDRGAELTNLRDWRDRMAADLAWVESLIEHVERGGDPPAQEQPNGRHQVGIGRPPEGRAPEGGE